MLAAVDGAVESVQAPMPELVVRESTAVPK
jgi:hypothetical protein